jgi:hypothetical protein
MTAQEPAELDPTTGTQGERLVPFVRVRCNPCRRVVSREMENARKGGFGLPKMEKLVRVCPHYKTVWAPGEGPGSPPPEGSGWDRTPPV